MGELFSALSHAMEQNLLLALVAAATWGVLSIVLSPCHLASIPLIIAFIGRDNQATVRRAFAIATIFSTGILITIALVGAITAVAGRLLGDIGATGNYLVAVILLLAGLHLLDVIPLPISAPRTANIQRRGLYAALILGLVFGIALGPCTFAFLAPVLAMAFRTGSSAPLYAGALLLAYGVGHCTVIVVAGTSSQWVQRYLNWNQHGHGADVLRKVCGVLVILGGLWLVYIA